MSGGPTLPDRGAPDATPADARGSGTTPSEDADRASRARRADFGEAGRRRIAPDASWIARRARMVRWSKYGLPVVAALLLGSLAFWPEFERENRLGRSSLRQDEAVMAHTGVMVAPRYHGIDNHDRPFLVTAASARQVSPERVDLTRPKADLVSASGMWMMVTADRGVYDPRAHILDLAGRVTLYRADGTILTMPVATLDVRRDIESSPDWVHVEGPFGVLDAQRSFLSSGDGIMQFGGPARLVLNQSKGAGS